MGGKTWVFLNRIKSVTLLEETIICSIEAHLVHFNSNSMFIQSSIVIRVVIFRDFPSCGWSYPDGQSAAGGLGENANTFAVFPHKTSQYGVVCTLSNCITYVSLSYVMIYSGIDGAYSCNSLALLFVSGVLLLLHFTAPRVQCSSNIVTAVFSAGAILERGASTGEGACDEGLPICSTDFLPRRVYDSVSILISD